MKTHRTSLSKAALTICAAIMSLVVGCNDQPALTGVAAAPSVTRKASFAAVGDAGAFDLGTLPGMSPSNALAINDAGAIVGTNGAGHAFVWSASAGLLDIDPPNSLGSNANGINGTGEIVGDYRNTTDGWAHAARWSAAGAFTDLGTLGGLTSTAQDVNDAGVVVGSSSSAPNLADRFPVQWSASGAISTVPLPPNNAGGEALAINNNGVIVGDFAQEFGGFRQQAFVDIPGQSPIAIQTPGVNVTSFAEDVNDAGQVVGYFLSNSSFPHAFLWTQADGLTDLGVPAGAQMSRAWGINSAGVVVGDDGNRATMWTAASGWQYVSSSVSIPAKINTDGFAVGRLIGPPQHAIRWNTTNSIPTVSAGGPYTATAGQPVTLTATASDADGDALSYSWVFGPGATASGASASFTYASSGTYTATVTVDDGRGGIATANATVNVAPAPPTITITGPTSVVEGTTATFTAVVADAGSDPLTVTWDLDGDGVFETTGLTAQRLFADNIPATVTITARVTAGTTSVTATHQVSVTNAPPAVTVTNAATTLTVGDVYTMSGSFSDAGLLDAPWTYQVQWGDGTTTSGSTTTQGAIGASHRYVAPGTYQAVLTVADKDGGIGSATTALITVNRLTVAMDIFPFGNAAGNIAQYNPRKPELSPPLEVALLGSATFQPIDPVTGAIQVNLASVHIGGTAIAMSNGAYLVEARDVNHDGVLDLVMTFRTEQLVANGDLSATANGAQAVVLTGTHADGRQFEAHASVRVVGHNGP